MKAHPILFNGAMVRAIRNGSKTQTRRVIPPARPSQRFVEPLNRCPYGVPGDRMWVRETHRAYGRWEQYETPERNLKWRFLAYPHQRHIIYADEPDQPAKPKRTEIGYHIRPGIFMPRRASRITPEITDVRVQRLQDISEEDAQTEGTEPYDVAGFSAEELSLLDAPLMESSNCYRNGFALLWESINGKHPGCTWSDNPWVWALSFRQSAPQGGK